MVRSGAMGTKTGAKQMSALHASLIDDIARIIEERGVNIGEVFDGEAGRPVHQGWNKWQRGSSPQLASIEAVAKKLGRKLNIALSDPSATVSPSVNESGEPLSPDLHHLMQQLEELEPVQRARVLGTLEGILAGLRMVPSEPVAESGAARRK